MPVELVNPDGIVKPDSYSQVALGSGSRVAFLSGQVAQDEWGQLVGRGDLAAQAEQAYTNVAIALKGIGASFADVARTTLYVVDWTPARMEELIAGAVRAGERFGFDPRTAMTLIGVVALANPDYLIEVETVAVLP